jgi:hypothetical protein
MDPVFYHCATAALSERLKHIHSLPLLVFSGRFCSYRKPNFPAVSVSLLAWIFWPYLLFLAGNFQP